jgi:hypothetical protein
VKFYGSSETERQTDTWDAKEPIPAWPTYSYLTNRMTQIGSSTPTYDANGNVTNDFLHTYTWDANGRPVTVDGVGLTYERLDGWWSRIAAAFTPKSCTGRAVLSLRTGGES